MSEQISFPGLGWTFDVNRVAFTVGDRPIYWYGILIAVAFFAGALYMMLRVKEFGLDADRVTDVLLGSVVFGIIGARLYYVAFSWEAYANDPISILYIWRGGIAIYGSIIGGVLAAIIICKWRKVKIFPMLDLAAASLLLGQAIGRWGNFINIEAFGSNTTAKWGMTSPTITWYLQQQKSALEAIGVTVLPDQPVHPTFFYESVWCLLGFLFLAWYTKRRRYDGELTLLYLGWYGLGRFFIEGLRTDSLMFGTIRVSQIVALICVIASVVLQLAVRSRIRRANDPDFLPLYVNTEEGKAVVSGEFYKKIKDKEVLLSDDSELETLSDSHADIEEETSKTEEEDWQVEDSTYESTEELSTNDSLDVENKADETVDSDREDE